MDKKQFFLFFHKKSTFCLNFDIFEDMGKKRFFSKWSLNNFLFLDIFGYISKKRRFPTDLKITSVLNIWAKNNFFSKRSKEKFLLLEFWYILVLGDFFKVISKKNLFPRNVDVSVDMEYLGTLKNFEVLRWGSTLS